MQNTSLFCLLTTFSVGLIQLGGDSEDAPAPVRESQVPSDAEFERRGFRCLFPFRLKGRGGAKTGKRRIKTRDIVSTWEAQDEALTDNGGNAKEPVCQLYLSLCEFAVTIVPHVLGTWVLLYCGYKWLLSS